MIPLFDRERSGKVPIVTIGLILLNIYIFYLEVNSTNLDTFFSTYALIPEKVRATSPETWIPFVTFMFLHGGIIHIGSNMLFLWIFGDNVEERLGWLYLPFYLLGGVLSGLAQYFLDPASSLPVVGASGAVAAVLGAYFVFFPTHTVATLVPIFFFVTILNLPALLVLGYWFVTQLFSGYAALGETSATSGGVAYFAHIGGFAFGWLVGLLFPEKPT